MFYSFDVYRIASVIDDRCLWGVCISMLFFEYSNLELQTS